jgi:hypothetical protein
MFDVWLLWRSSDLLSKTLTHEGGTFMSRQNVNLVQSLYEAFARGDIPAILGAMDPDIVWDIPQAPDYPLGGIHRGPQGIANEFLTSSRRTIWSSPLFPTMWWMMETR